MHCVNVAYALAMVLNSLDNDRIASHFDDSDGLVLGKEFACRYNIHDFAPNLHFPRGVASGYG